MFKPLLACSILLLSTPGVIAKMTDSDDVTFFELQVRPVLAGKCLKCHGPNKVSGGLRLDSREAILKGGDHGPAVIPGDVSKSLLVRAIQHSDELELRMPPGTRLAQASIDALTQWVKRGAPWPANLSGSVSLKDVSKPHWAFQPLTHPRPPADPSAWSANPVDQFISARWREHGLSPVEAASKSALLRRITFDLIGLPPTPAEQSAFLRDQSSAAYARVVERLLASPHYGERWGRHWMDIVRYADTAGDNADYPVPEAALYRDYLIQTFNADKPYSEFICEQLAGDLLTDQQSSTPYRDRVVATTYLGLARRYLTAPYESWELTLEDVIDTTGRAFLGLTMRCARCHDHKFDPVTKEDYYALYGIFASTQFPYAGSEEFASMKRPREHFVPLCTPAQAKQKLQARNQSMEKLRANLTRLEKESAAARRVAALDLIIKTQTELIGALQKQQANSEDVLKELERNRSERKRWNNDLQQELKRPRTELALLERTNLPPDLPGAYGVSEGKIVNVPVQLGGDPARSGPIIKRGAPKFLTKAVPCNIPDEASGRLEFARFLVSPRNPLTARVMVNRIWQHHFGRGLTATPSNFGMRGEAPTHPELLDYLASYFIQNGWSIKAMHRLIVHSRAYQLASSTSDSNREKDASNTCYWRHDRRRLDAEAIRDTLLAVSENLDLRQPEPQPFPLISSWGWTQHQPFKEVYATNRRSIYLMTQRLQRHPFLALFDGPDTNATTDVRGTSTVPLQALYLLNNNFVVEQSHDLARRIQSEPGQDVDRVTHAYRLALGRVPTKTEVERAVKFIDAYRRQAIELRKTVDSACNESWASFAHTLLCSNEFIYVD